MGNKVWEMNHFLVSDGVKEELLGNNRMVLFPKEDYIERAIRMAPLRQVSVSPLQLLRYFNPKFKCKFMLLLCFRRLVALKGLESRSNKSRHTDVIGLTI